MVEEEWRAVPDHPGYEVSSLARVRSYRDRQGHPTDRPRLMTPFPIEQGYFRIKLGRGHTLGLHTVVLKAFVGPRPLGLLCRHLDGNPGNNKPDNLAWGTAAENYADRRLHGTHLDGERNGRAKLTAIAVRAIRASTDTAEVLATRYGVSKSAVDHILYGRTWKTI